MKLKKYSKLVLGMCTVLGIVIVLVAMGITSQAEEVKDEISSAKTDDSLKLVNQKCSTIIELLSKEYNLNELNEDNWKDYQIKMVNYLDNNQKPEWYNETNDEYAKLACFFDIYENDKVVKANKVNVNKNRTMTTKKIYNERVATEYAKKYVLKPNEKQFKTCEFDCTNFVSQIVYTGGKSMDSKWYAKCGMLNKNVYSKYSMEWCNADYFVDYFGTYMTFDNHKDFAENIKVGDIIAYDMQSDDDWDHVGYVTDCKVYDDVLGYADYKVAQHSRYYHDWASSDNNGWDAMEENYKNITFAIVRMK